MKPFETITLTYQGDVGLLTLSDQATLNAASIGMVEELQVALDDVTTKARCVLLTGAGRAFCSGARLSAALAIDDSAYDAGAYLESHYNPLMQRLRALPIPLVTAVNGPAVGIGASIALAGDLIVAAETSYFLQAFRNIGLVPDGGSAFLLVHAAGRARASEMMLLGDRVPAAKALEWGMINRVVASEQLVETALDLAALLADGPTHALAMTRQLCWDAAESSFAAMITRERAFQRIAGRTVDHREGISAFLEKRKARFLGR
jgi:2-(1,2-epoxy-1,2-dihydrophenyl)acetyl-CoA isomerase